MKKLIIPVIIICISVLILYFTSKTFFIKEISGNCHNDKLSIHYLFTAETVYEEIHITGKSGTYIYYDSSKIKGSQHLLMQQPVWKKEDLTAKAFTLSTPEAAELMDMLEETKFMQLNDVYGGAEKGQRYYAFSLTVGYGGKIKSVVYQDFPEAKPAPEAFVTIREALIGLAKNKLIKR